MTVTLKGVHRVIARLADGRRVEYHYAWRGGPRLPGAPGSPQYLAAYQSSRKPEKAASGQIFGLAVDFKRSPEFAALRPSTVRAYRHSLDAIVAEFGDMPLAAAADRRARREFLAWRDTLAAHPRAADMAIGVLRRLLAFGLDRGMIDHNPLANVRGLHRRSGEVTIWTADDLVRLAAHASPELMGAVRLGAETGLRQGDLIRLTWTAIGPRSILWRTAKRSRDVTIPITTAARAALDSMPRRAVTVLTTAKTGRPWTADGLRASLRAACKGAGVERTFHDLRRTAATRLVGAGLSDAQVAGIMGWAERDVTVLRLRYVDQAAVVTALLDRLDMERLGNAPV